MSSAHSSTGWDCSRDGVGIVSVMPSLSGPVLVVGAGLIGTSVGLALSRRGIQVHLRDNTPTTAHIAASRGAGFDSEPTRPPELVVVATPPDLLGMQVAEATREFPTAVVTDTCSVKTRVLADARSAGAVLDRYVGGHPLAGSERSGPLAAAADLFEGRSWAITPHEDSRPDAVETVAGLVDACGGLVVRLDAGEHDAAVARTSHLPHVMAAVVAASLRGVPGQHLALSGQGLRDVTRIAAGEPGLWRQILGANAAPVAALLRRVHADLGDLADALEAGDTAPVEELLKAGVAGTVAIPGKHGGPPLELTPVTVAIPDRPGSLAELFAVAGEAGVNIEDLRIDHDPARAYGLVEIDVAPDHADVLAAALRARGWTVHR